MASNSNQSQVYTKNTRRGRGKNFTRSQISVLELSFGNDPYLSTEERARLASLLEVTEKRVQGWFKNNRIKATKAYFANLLNRNNPQPMMPPMRTAAVPATWSTRVRAAHKCKDCGHYRDHGIPVPPEVGDSSSSSYDGNGGGGGNRSYYSDCPCILARQRTVVRTPWTKQNSPPHYVPIRTPYQCEMRMAGALGFVNAFGSEFLQQNSQTTSTDPSPPAE